MDPDNENLPEILEREARIEALEDQLARERRLNTRLCKELVAERGLTTELHAAGRREVNRAKGPSPTLLRGESGPDGDELTQRDLDEASKL